MNRWTRFSLSAIALAALFILAVPAAAVWAQQPSKIPVLIGFNRQPGPAEEALVRRAGGSIKYTYRLIPAIAATLPDNAIDGLSRNPNVSVIEPDGLVHKIDFQSELDNTWGVKRVDAGAVHTAGNTGAGVKVAIIDSGVDYTHPDLGGCLGTGCKVAGGYDFVNDDGNPMDDDGHGTHVAGTVAAKRDGFGVVGVAPDVKIYALKVLNSSGSGSFSDVIAALQWAVANGIQVTNNSYGSSQDPGTLVKNAFDNSYASGILHVAAAGNSGNCKGKNNSVGYPAQYSSVIAVAATGQSNSRPCWSSTGPAVEISAPGVAINSTKMGGGYVQFSGTSMASPHVAGVAALALSMAEAPSPTQVRETLKSTAIDLGETGADSHYGFGLVNAPAVVTALSSPSPAPPPAPAVNVALSTDKSSYVNGADANAVLTAMVTDENGTAVAGLASSAFATTVNGAPVSVTFAETATAGTYTADLSLSGFDIGAYGVSVTATDSRPISGNGSANFSIEAASSSTTASVASITYATTGGKNSDKHLNISLTVVNNSGAAISGATVAINLRRDGIIAASGSGTTNSAGIVTFVYNNAPSGTYDTVVTNVIASGLTWDDITPSNSFIK